MQKKQLLGSGEIENLKEEKRELENALRESEGYGSGTGRDINRGAIQNQIKKLDNAIDMGTPGKIPGRTKDQLAARAKELETQFEQGMPTRDEMSRPGKNPGAVKKHMMWLKRNEFNGSVDEYRQIQRTLNPGEELSIERLRKDK